MREAPKSRLPRAKEAKSLKLGESECWPIAAAIHLCATSHNCHRSHTPFLESCLRVSRFGGKSIHAYSCVKTSYFPLLNQLQQSRLGARILLLRRILYLCLAFKSLTRLRSQSFLLPTNKAARFSQWQVRTSASIG